MQALIRAIDALSEWTGAAVKWLVVILTAIIGYEIVARYVFNAPTKWGFDISYMVGGTLFLLGEAVTLKNRHHVRIDLFYNRFSPRRRALVDVLFYLVFFFPLWVGLFWALIPYTLFAWQIQERSMQGYWQPILYPFKTVMPVGVLLLLLQGLAELLKSLVALGRKGEDAP